MKALMGPTGPPGPKGARGPIGFAIKGDRGYPGIKGAKGSTRVLLGPTVKNGDPGEKGQMGPKGAKGSRGPPGFPKERVSLNLIWYFCKSGFSYPWSKISLRLPFLRHEVSTRVRLRTYRSQLSNCQLFKAPNRLYPLCENPG